MTPGLGQASPGRGLGTQPGIPCQWLGPSCWSHHLLPTGHVLAGDLETRCSSPRCVAGTQLLEPWTCCLPRSSSAGTRSGVGTQTQALRGTTWVFVVMPNIYPQILASLGYLSNLARPLSVTFYWWGLVLFQACDCLFGWCHSWHWGPWSVISGHCLYLQWHDILRSRMLNLWL